MTAVSLPIIIICLVVIFIFGGIGSVVAAILGTAIGIAILRAWDKRQQR